LQEKRNQPHLKIIPSYILPKGAASATITSSAPSKRKEFVPFKKGGRDPLRTFAVTKRSRTTAGLTKDRKAKKKR
jgi:hypothetical protein